MACIGEVFGEKWGRNPLPEGRGEAGNLKQDWSLDSLHRLPSVSKCPQSTEGEAVADMLTFRDNSWQQSGNKWCRQKHRESMNGTRNKTKENKQKNPKNQEGEKKQNIQKKGGKKKTIEKTTTQDLVNWVCHLCYLFFSFFSFHLFIHLFLCLFLRYILYIIYKYIYVYIYSHSFIQNLSIDSFVLLWQGIYILLVQRLAC